MGIPHKLRPTGSAGAPLPLGYVKLLYARFDQRQQLETGVKLANNREFFADLQFLAPTQVPESGPGSTPTWRYENVVFANRSRLYPDTYASTAQLVLIQYVNRDYIIFTDFKGWSNRTVPTSKKISDRLQVSFAYNYIELDGARVDISSNPITAFPTSYPMNVGFNIDTYRRLNANVYRIHIKNNGVIIHEWVPALDPEGRCCFFDLVTKNPYYSSTSVDFIPGPKY